MAAFGKMTVWEVERRLGILIQFRNLLITYYNNTKPGSLLQMVPNQIGMNIRQDINTIFDEARESMYIAHFYGILGNCYGKMSVIENPFELNHFISPQFLIDEIEKAIGKYQRDLPKARIRTVNPFFWFNQLIALILGFPFRLLASTGLVDESKLDTSPIFRIPKAFVVFVGTLITYTVGIVTVAEKLGYLDALKSLIKRIL